jgi:hypothetical protein
MVAVITLDPSVTLLANPEEFTDTALEVSPNDAEEALQATCDVISSWLPSA